MKTNLQIVKQKQKNKNDHQIRIIIKIYHIIIKKKKKNDMQDFYQNHYIFILKYLKH